MIERTEKRRRSGKAGRADLDVLIGQKFVERDADPRVSGLVGREPFNDLGIVGDRHDGINREPDSP